MNKEDQKSKSENDPSHLPFALPAGAELLKTDLRELPISTLAWIGDSVFDLYVRLNLVNSHKRSPSGNLHQAAIKIVSANAQCESINYLLPSLNEFEAAFVRRARNHEPHSLPRNSDPLQYRMATALESLIGYYYLAGNLTRLTELMEMILAKQELDLKK